MRWNRRIQVSAMCVAALSLSSTSGQSAELKAWDQEAVASLAKQLSETVTQLRQTAINDPNLLNRNAPNSRSAQKLRDSLRLLEKSCRQFAGKLEAGGDRTKTTGIAKKTGTLIRRTQLAGRRVMISDSMWAAIDPTIELINSISPYYSEESPLLPPSQQR